MFSHSFYFNAIERKIYIEKLCCNFKVPIYIIYVHSYYILYNKRIIHSVVFYVIKSGRRDERYVASSIEIIHKNSYHENKKCKM